MIINPMPPSSSSSGMVNAFIYSEPNENTDIYRAIIDRIVKVNLKHVLCVNNKAESFQRFFGCAQFNSSCMYL